MIDGAALVRGDADWHRTGSVAVNDLGQCQLPDGSSSCGHRADPLAVFVWMSALTQPESIRKSFLTCAYIRAHAAICFMALILYRVMRQRLKIANTSLSPERALEYLRRIQHHQIRLNASEPVTGVSAISAQQSEVLNALNVKKPVAPQQLALL